MNDVREKLVEIVFKSLCNHIHKSCKLTENIADDLIANGVRLKEKQATSDESKQWIPVTDGLPECYLVRDIFKRPQHYMSDPVLVTVKSEECDGIHYFVGTDYISGREKDNVDWVRTCCYGGSAVYHQEIIAWMPKPAAYNEGE